MSYVNEAIDAFVTRLIDERIHSSFIRRNPLLYFLAGPNVDNMGRLGQPGTPVVFGGADIGTATRMQTLGSKGHEFRYQKAEPNDNDFANVSYGGSTPTANGYAEDDFGTAETRWTHHDTAIKIRKDSIKMARGATAIGALVEDSVGPRINFHLKKIQDRFWNGTLSSSAQDATVWTDYLGVVHTINQNNTYARINRSVETEMNSVQKDVGGESATLSEVITDANIIQGITGKSPNGEGIDLVVTTPKLFVMWRNQLEGEIQKFTDGIPNHPFGGYGSQILRYDNTWLTYDADCPPNNAFLFNLGSWLYEVDDDYNFSLDGEWVEKDKTEEGGAHYIWNLIRTWGRLTCRAPWLQARYYNITEVTSESLSSSSSSVTNSSSSSSQSESSSSSSQSSASGV